MPSNTPGGATAAPRAPTTWAGASTTSWRPPASPQRSPAARWRASRASPTTRPTSWTTTRERRQAVDLEGVHAARGADDVLLRFRLGHAVPAGRRHAGVLAQGKRHRAEEHHAHRQRRHDLHAQVPVGAAGRPLAAAAAGPFRSEEHTSELQSRENLVCRLLLEKKK